MGGFGLQDFDGILVFGAATTHKYKSNSDFEAQYIHTYIGTGSILNSSAAVGLGFVSIMVLTGRAFGSGGVLSFLLKQKQFISACYNSIRKD